MAGKIQVKLAGGRLGTRGGKLYKKGDILEIDANPENLKGAFKAAYRAGRFVPVTVTMQAEGQVKEPQRPVPPSPIPPEETKPTAKPAGKPPDKKTPVKKKKK